MLDIGIMMDRLASARPIFHSEADFQHALAWTIHEEHRNAKVRLEYRPQGQEDTYLDLWVADEGEATAVELKYVTRACRAIVDGEEFRVRNHAAEDQRRYDFVKDIARLEKVAQRNGARGFAVFLSNNSGFWTPPRSANAVDRDFRLHEGRVLTGTLQWDPGAGVGTTEARDRPLSLSGEYHLAWRDYSHRDSAVYRYLLVAIS